ncbi:MAG: type II secretion system F family protein [Nanoarchaeota archaeon]|nr:type II secretion system F family protein [Nanoarchaeota archaeon]MBU1270258.1 type II secretion system F family protein [Nanoarchaeota archaeon]MBU1604842.1 type II secretion system F family protein [Nanoarchaeota archaeon]MBU2442488.1 type II secretion system F family protein [Nanoarchaeota archaeon]
MIKDLLYLELFGKAFVPKKLRPQLRDYLYKAGITEVPYKFFGGLFWVTLVVTYFIYFSTIFRPLSKYGAFAVLIFTFISWFLIQSLMVVLVIFSVYFYLNIRIYNRVLNMEKHLPDYLTLVSNNLKGGLSFEKSLWLAIKSEFGVLAKEMTLASKRVLTGNDVKDSLLILSQKYDSPSLKRSLNLIIGELEAGGQIAKVMDKIVDNLKKTSALKQEMAAATVTYTIFMVAIVLFITPALFALAQQLLQIIIGVTKTISASGTGSNSPISSIGQSSIDPKDFKTFSIIAIGIISAFSSMIISIISKGDIRGGIKYIPLFIIIGITLFLMVSNALGGFFGGIG